MPQQPPRPQVKTPARAAAEPSEPPVDVELDEPTRSRLADVIAKAITDELGRGVRLSSAPPPSSETTPPRSSMRAAADAGKAAAVKVGVPGLIGTGALTLLGGLVALWRPEYLVPIVKMLAALAAAHGGTPPPEGLP